MEPSDFYFIVMPLACLLFALIPAVWYYAKKEEYKDKELQKLAQQLRTGAIDKKTFEGMKDKLLQDRAFAREMNRLQNLLENESIDEDTYVRWKKILTHAQMTEKSLETFKPQQRYGQS